MKKQLPVASVAAFSFAMNAAAMTVHPQATDEALINPGMGLVHYAYSSRIWAYDTGLEPGDTLDDLIPGTTVELLKPGKYTLAVSVGRADGKPEIALPLANGRNRMYPLGTVEVVRCRQ